MSKIEKFTRGLKGRFDSPKKEPAHSRYWSIRRRVEREISNENIWRNNAENFEWYWMKVINLYPHLSWMQSKHTN